jgi:hypothetical protein
LKKFLENINTFLVEGLGLAGGLIWGINTNWNWEPVILIAVSFVGVVIFILLRFLPDHEDRPMVELELTGGNGFRSPPGLIKDISPKTEDGTAYVIEIGGTYLFNVRRNFDLVIRNNSKNNAYNILLYKSNTSYPVRFETKYSSLEPLTIDKPLKLRIVYEVYRPMTHDQAEDILQSNVPDDLKHFVVLLEYKSESRRKYYTKFTPRNTNEHLKKNPNLKQFEKV